MPAGRRYTDQLNQAQPFKIWSLDFDPATLSVVNASQFTCYVYIGTHSKPGQKGFSDAIAPLSMYVADPAGAKDFAIFVDNSAAPNTPFTFPVTIIFSTGAASVQTPLSSALLASLIGSNYDNKVVQICGNKIVMFVLLEDLICCSALEMMAAQNLTYGSSQISYSAPGIGDGKTSIQFGGAANGQVTFPAPVLSYLNGSGKFNPLKGTMWVWLYVTGTNMASATTYYFCTLGVDANNFFAIQKLTANNILGNAMIGGTSKNINVGYIGDAWAHFCITWNRDTNLMRFYLNGVSQGTPQSLTTTWVGTLAAGYTQLASQNNAGYLAGWMAKWGFCNDELAAADIAALAAIY